MAVTIGATDKKYVTALGVDTREWLPEILDVNNDEGLLEIMEIVGRYKKVTQPIYSNFTHDAILKLLDTTGATVTGSGTATVGTTLTAATSGFVRKTDLIKFPNRKVGYVTNVVRAGTPSVDTVTIKSVDGSNLTHTAAQLLSVFSGAVGERSKEPENRKYGLNQYSNKIQIFREINEDTDIAMNSTIELTYKGSHYIVDRERAIKELTFKAMINGAIIGGEMSSTSFSDASPALVDPINGGAVQTTRGLDFYVTTYGIDDAVAVDDTWTFTDLDDTIFRMIAARTGRNYLILGSTRAMLKVSNYLKGISSGITAGRLMLDGKSFDYGVTDLTYGNFKFQFVGMPIFDHPEMFSQTDITKSLYFIPKDSVKTFGGSSSVQPRIQMMYMDHNVQNNLGTEYIAEFDTGALARGGAKDSEMVNKFHLVSYQGLQILGAQHFAKVRVLAA